MIVCGIDIQGSGAILVFLAGTLESHTPVGLYARKVDLQNDNVQDQVRSFVDGMSTYFANEGVEKVGVRGRISRGRFAGGGVSFKIEALIQVQRVPVSIVPTATLNAWVKRQSLSMPEELNAYQQTAYSLACFLLGN